MDNANYFINEQETKEGFQKIVKVVKRLINDSKLCLENGRYSASVSLSILALEETAKADFFRVKLNEKKGITKKEWEDLTAGGKSHIIKLNWFLDKKEKKIEKWTDEDIEVLDKLSAEFGFYSHHGNKEETRKQIKLLKAFTQKYNIIKQSCFYTNWNNKEHKWVYFDTLFPDKIKILIANALFLESKRGFLMLQFAKELPLKKFSDYTDEDWQKAYNSNIRIEITKTYQEINRKVIKDFELFTTAINRLD